MSYESKIQAAREVLEEHNRRQGRKEIGIDNFFSNLRERGGTNEGALSKCSWENIQKMGSMVHDIPLLLARQIADIFRSKGPEDFVPPGWEVAERIPIIFNRILGFRKDFGLMDGKGVSFRVEHHWEKPGFFYIQLFEGTQYPEIRYIKKRVFREGDVLQLAGEEEENPLCKLPIVVFLHGRELFVLKREAVACGAL